MAVQTTGATSNHNLLTLYYVFMSFGAPSGGTEMSTPLRGATSNECEKSLPSRNKISPFGRNDREFQFMSEVYGED